MESEAKQFHFLKLLDRWTSGNALDSQSRGCEFDPQTDQVFWMRL